VQLCQPRKQIWEALHPVQTSLDVGKVLPYDANDDPENDDIEVGNLFPPQVSAHGGARPQTKGFAASTAEATGMTKRSINQHIARADALGGEALTKSFQIALRWPESICWCNCANDSVNRASTDHGVIDRFASSLMLSNTSSTQITPEL